jgi:hypothetical protein
MFLLYLDDSGSVKNPQDRHVILAGVSVFERLPFWFSGALDNVAKKLWPTNPFELEFRGSDIFAGRRQWRSIDRAKRIESYCDGLQILARSNHIRLFGAAIHKQAIAPADPIEYAFEQLINRFDLYLSRLYKLGNTQRGMIILDQGSYETALQKLAAEFRQVGHRWGQLRNIAEVPLFVSSKATRMIQFADMVAFAMRFYYEHGNATYIDLIKHLFDSEGGLLHGLVHYTPAGMMCNCLICRQK